MQLYFENTLTSAVGQALSSSSHHENLYGDVFVKKLKTVTFFARFLFVLRITACIFVSWSSRNVEVFSVGDSKHYSDFIVIRFRVGKDLDIHVKRFTFLQPHSRTHPNMHALLQQWGEFFSFLPLASSECIYCVRWRIYLVIHLNFHARNDVGS